MWPAGSSNIYKSSVTFLKKLIKKEMKVGLEKIQFHAFGSLSFPECPIKISE
jgi:hypothetical protein